MTKNLAIGVDIGGSHISCAAVNLAAKRYFPETLAENTLNNHAGADEIIGIWVKTIEEAIQKTNAAEIAGIGFAMPGPFDYDRGIALFDEGVQKYENLYGLNVAQAIRKQMNLPEDFPIRFINDATAFAIAEDWIGKSAGTSRSLAITLGTGFGSAFLRNRIPVISGDEVPAMGYVYHLPFEGGNADDYFSTRGLLKRYEMKTGQKLSGVKELAYEAERNQIILGLFSDFGLKLGVFMKPWLQKFGVEVLVIGGNISNAFDLFGASLLSYLKENQIQTKVEISELKETASMIGSAVLVGNTYR
jgi:Transcriptional regulator/sugar kinase